jgi:hypothetical protein
MPVKLVDFLAGLQVPNMDFPGTRRQEAAVRVEGNLPRASVGVFDIALMDYLAGRYFQSHEPKIVAEVEAAILLLYPALLENSERDSATIGREGDRRGFFLTEYAGLRSALLGFWGVWSLTLSPSR